MRSCSNKFHRSGACGVVSLAKQRAYLLLAEEVVIDCPISSGKHGHTSPSARFPCSRKIPIIIHNLCDFVDHSGRVVRAGVSARIDAAPSGTHFAGAAMKWFMRLMGRRRHARGDSSRLSSFARLHSDALRRRQALLRSRQGWYAGSGSSSRKLGASGGSAAIHELSCLRSISNAACAVCCLNVRDRWGRTIALATVSLLADASATKTVPTGFSIDPPPGPAMPVVASAKSVRDACVLLQAIAPRQFTNRSILRNQFGIHRENVNFASFE